MKPNLYIAATFLLSAIVALAGGWHEKVHAQQAAHHHGHAPSATVELGMGAAIDSDGRL